MDWLTADCRGVIMGSSSSTNSNEYGLGLSGDTVQLLDGEGGIVDAVTITHPAPPVIPFIPPAANAIPIADNEADAAIRTGTAGTSTDYARADHNHPIRRQANPGTPTPVLSGPATENLNELRRFRSTEEWVRFSWRMSVSMTTANGWVIYTFPSIGGFQPPILHCAGAYMQTGGQDNSDIQTSSMSKNGVDWADISRMYYGQFAGKETAETWWPNIHATYIRA